MVKSLELYLRDHRCLPLLAKVNEKERILSHLRTLSLFSTWLNSQEYQFFQSLLKNKAVLRHLMILDLGVLARKEFFQTFQQLPNYCEKLHSLSFSTSQKELTDANCFPKTFDDNTCLEDENYLESLEDFKTLKKLHITSYHNLAFLLNAKLPSSLQNLRLEFSLFDWENYENLSDTTPFHHSLKNLTNLKQLEFWFSRTSDNESQTEKYSLAKKSFIESLLKNIPRLTRLDIRTSSRFSFDSIPLTGSIPFDFPHFLTCMNHFSDSLEVLDIADEGCFFKFMTESGLPSLHFPKLSYLYLIGDMSNLDLESILGLSSKINLSKIPVHSLKKLLDVFLLVGQFKDIEKKRVEINIDVKDFKRNPSDEDYFKENYEEVKKKIQGVDLKNISLKILLGKELMFQKEIESFQDVFRKLDLKR